MKRKLSFISLSALLIAVFWYGCQNDAREVERGLALQPSTETGDFENGIILPTCGTTTWDLTAGQTIVVGDVTVENDADNIYITYSLDLTMFPDACFGALHAWVGSDPSSLPREIDKRPAPGQLCKLPGGACPTDAFGQTSYTITISLEDAGVTDLSESCDQSLYVITHAEVDLDCDPETGELETAFGGPEPGGGSAWWFYGNYNTCCPCEQWIVFGSNLNAGTAALDDAIYAYDLKAQTQTLVHDPTPVDPSGNYPNANAYDPVNQHIYAGTEDGRLFYYDIVDDEWVQLTTNENFGAMACGAWYDGNFYYVQNGTNRLYKVTISGTTATREQIGTVPTSNGYGDIVFDPANPGVFIGSAGSPTAVWYWYDINSGENGTLTRSGGEVKHLQLAYGSNGVLYGVEAISGQFYTVEYEYDAEAGTGTVTLTEDWDSPYTFTDLASGPQCQ